MVHKHEIPDFLVILYIKRSIHAFGDDSDIHALFHLCFSQ